MPRKLPWLVDVAKPKVVAPRPVPSTNPRARLPNPGDLVNSDLDTLPEAPQQFKKPNAAIYREPSSSPPRDIAGPPPAEYMRDGFTGDGDDVFVMVEDEFYSTAQIYTQHIHHAEYARLKRLHRSRGRETLENLQRATDGQTEASGQTKMKMKMKSGQKDQMRHMAFDVGSESEEDEYMFDSRLAGLMTGGQVESKGGLDPSRLTNRDARSERTESGMFGTGSLKTYVRRPISDAEEQDKQTTEDEDDLDAGFRGPRLDDQPVSNTARETTERWEVNELKGEANSSIGLARRKSTTEISSDPTPTDQTSTPAATSPRLSYMERRKLAKENRQSPSPASNGHSGLGMSNKAMPHPPSSPHNPSLPIKQGFRDNYAPTAAKRSRAVEYLAQQKARQLKQEAQTTKVKVEEDDIIPTFLV